ncbi:MAG: FecR domain-containing protein [Erythrobacter sp.]
MTAARPLIALVAVLAASLAAMPAWAQRMQRPAPAAGTISAARGGEEATLVPERSWRRVVASQDLKAGDVLRTNANGTLAIVFADRTQIRLGRNSVLVVKAVAAAAPSALELQSGRLWGRSPRARSNLRIETPSATAAIRGTEWAIEATGESTALAVYEGSVDFFNDFGRLEVGGGSAASARLGQAPTRTILTDPVGRSQMLFFLRPRDGIEILRGQSPALAEYIAGLDAGGIPPPEPPINRDDPGSYVLAGFLAAYRGDLEEAQRIAEAGLAVHPRALALHELRARVAMLRGDPAMVRAATAAALAIDPADPAALAISAELAAQFDGQPLVARELAQRAVAADPARIGSLQVLADILAEREADGEALAALDRALALDPDNAALEARRASVLLRQDRFPAAAAALARAEALDPSLAVVRAARADYLVRSGKLAAAEEFARAATAENPAYARALVQLAEIAARKGNIAEAEQQLDAADRLDPEEPRTALARTAIALNRFAADAAIAGARQALQRFQARGGIYTNLSENRAAGSFVSQAFRFLDLEGWGRYYADRVFDSFTPSSYFDQALNQTPGPFVIRDAQGRFNPLDSADLDRTSSFLQGLSLDPLGVANSEWRIQFSNERFLEPRLTLRALDERQLRNHAIAASLDGLVTGAVPFAFGVEAEASFPRDGRPRIDVGPDGRGGQGDTQRIEGFFGLAPSAADHIAVTARWRRENIPAFGALRDGQVAQVEDLSVGERFVFGLWSHELAARNRITLAGGLLRKDQRILSRNIDPQPLPPDFPAARFPDLINIVEQAIRFASLTYASSLDQQDRLDLRAGVEFADFSHRSTLGRVDFDAPRNQDPAEAEVPSDLYELRSHLDLRYAGIADLILQGQVEVVYIRDRLANVAPTLTGVDDTRLNARLGAAWEPVTGHWLRGAILHDSGQLFPFSLKPVNVIGLKGNAAPVELVSPSTSVIGRWDAQWTRDLFTSIEYQHQHFRSLAYETPDIRIRIGGGPVSLQRLALEANWLPGHNVGIRLAYAFTQSRILGFFATGDNAFFVPGSGCSLGPDDPCQFQRGDAVPFVPRHNAVASLTWSMPAPVRLRANLSATHLAGQSSDIRTPLADYTLVDARLEWEPFGRRMAIRAGMLNLLDARYETVRGFPAPRRTLTAELTLRF